MKYKLRSFPSYRISLLLSCALFMVAAPSSAQIIGPSDLDAAGNSVTAGGNTYEYAVGQLVAANTFISPSLVVTHGVLQPVNMTTITRHPISSRDLQVYPSPVTTKVYIHPAFKGAGKLQYGLYDAAGKLVAKREKTLHTGTERQELEVGHIAAGQYILNVTWIQAGIRYESGYKLQKLN